MISTSHCRERLSAKSFNILALVLNGCISLLIVGPHAVCHQAGGLDSVRLRMWHTDNISVRTVVTSRKCCAKLSTVLAVAASCVLVRATFVSGLSVGRFSGIPLTVL